MKTIRTVTKLVEKNEQVKAVPKYKLKQYMEVYSGPYEGHNFWIADIRFNYDLGKFEYLYNGCLMGGWYTENHIVPA